MSFSALNAGATVLTFDDIGTSIYGEITDGYGGFIWGPLSTVKYVKSDLHQMYANGTVSGDYVARNDWNGQNLSAQMEEGTFDFNGVWMSSGGFDDHIDVYGYRDGQKIYDVDIYLNWGPAEWFQFDFVGIDRLYFEAHCISFTMDNFTYNEPVPEPTTMLLLGSGLIGIAGFRRKFKKS